MQNNLTVCLVEETHGLVLFLNAHNSNLSIWMTSIQMHWNEEKSAHFIFNMSWKLKTIPEMHCQQLTSLWFCIILSKKLTTKSLRQCAFITAKTGRNRIWFWEYWKYQAFPRGYFKVPYDVAQRNILDGMFGYFQHSQDQIAPQGMWCPLWCDALPLRVCPVGHVWVSGGCIVSIVTGFLWAGFHKSAVIFVIVKR